MSYIGNEPISAAFLVDTFSGNGSTVAFTMSVAPANTSSIIVAITGVVQDPSTYSVAGTTLTFSAAPPTGTSNISVRYLGIPASGVTTTAYRTVTDTTATAGQTTFTIPSYTVGYVDVYRNGVRLAAADYTATTGTTVVLASGATAGDTITTESFYVSSVLNAIPQYNGTSVNQTLTTPTANTLTSGSGSNLQLQTNGGTTALTLDTSGNAGLGVTPSAWYSSSKAIQLQGGAFWSYATGYLQMLQNGYYNGSNYIYKNNGYASEYIQISGQHQWFTAASGTAGNAISFTQAMTLDSSGNLGVGVTPSAWGSSNKAIQFGRGFVQTDGSGTGSSGYGRNAYQAGSWYYQANGYANMLNIETDGAFKFFTAPSGTAGNAISFTQAMTLDSSGNLLVGATSQVNSEKFLVVQPNANYSQTIKNSNASPNGLYIVYSGASPNNTANEFLYFNDSTTTRLMVKSNGGIYNYSANNSNLSDERTKTDIQNAGGYLAKICAIPVRTFKYKDQTDDLLNLGVIAQEVEAVAPELVDASGFGETPEDGVPLKAIYQTDLQYALMKSIQELKAIVDAQAVEIAALKGQA